MSNSPFLRLVAEIKDQRERLHRRLRVSAPHESLVLAAVALVILAIVAWLVFGTVARSVSADCVVIEAGERWAVASAEPGQLLQFLVGPGDHIDAGQPIARQSVPELDREAEVLRERLDGLQAESAPTGALRPLVAPVREALLQVSVRRAVRESIVSQRAGTVMDLLSVPGAFLSPDTPVALIRAAGDASHSAVLRVDREVGRRIQPGMQASVEIPVTDRGTRRLTGVVASVAAGPLPRWLAEVEPAVPVSAYRVDISLTPEAGPVVPDGTACRAGIALGGQSPADLFFLGRS